MKRGPKLTETQRIDLLAVYLSQGFEAAKPVAISLGVTAKYVAALARKRGHTGNHHRRQNPKTAMTYNDPRWARAIAVGPVTA
jgi:hypothetical protein